MKMLRKVALLLLAGALFTFGGDAKADFASITPAGSTQGDATTATADDLFVTSASADQGILLKARPFGSKYSVTNGSSVNIKVYPHSGAKINNGTANAAVIVAPGQKVDFVAFDADDWLANYPDLASGTQDPSFDDPTMDDPTMDDPVVDDATLDDITVGQVKTADNVGTVTTGATTTAVEYGWDNYHVTRLTMTAFAIGTSGDNANLALGAKFYTFPAGAIMVDFTSLSGGVTCAISVTTDTPEIGIGTVVASGAAATLTTATWENLVDGGAAGATTDADAVLADVAGTAIQKANLSTIRPIIQASGGAARDLFLNIADGWADVTAAGACTFTGTITIGWRLL